jgi:hypothetical protein
MKSPSVLTFFPINAGVVVAGSTKNVLQISLQIVNYSKWHYNKGFEDDLWKNLHSQIS